MIKEAKRLPSVNPSMITKKFSSKEREDILIENFIGLQKAMTNLSIKFENLSDNITKLLSIFELSAKDYLVSKGKNMSNTDQDLLNKINLLLEQNKAVAKGIVMLDEKLRGKDNSFTPQQYVPSSQPNFNPGQNTQQLKPKPLQGI